MNDPTNDRKIEHIRIIESDRDVDRRKLYFETIRLTHRALPEINLSDVNPATTFLGKRLAFPLLISSMTGGDHDLVRTINHNLAMAAEASGVAMGVGSQRVMFTHPEARDSFALRESAPTALLCSNLGAIQLNYGFDVQTCREAISVLGADALYLHLNPLQEAIQPEGNTNFRGLLAKITEIAATLDVPVILKEVGAGFSPADLEGLRGSAVRYIDIAGAGGTSWSRIENHRSTGDSDGLGILFQDWGIPTPVALQLLRPYQDEFEIIASGGIRTGLDMVKAVILGARLCGLASPFLKPAIKSSEAVIAVIDRLKSEFITAMFLMGITTTADLFQNESLILQA